MTGGRTYGPIESSNVSIGPYVSMHHKRQALHTVLLSSVTGESEALERPVPLEWHNTEGLECDKRQARERPLCCFWSALRHVLQHRCNTHCSTYCNAHWNTHCNTRCNTH